MARIQTPDERPQPICIVCLKKPEEIDEYIDAAREEGITPTAYVRREEPTLNPVNQHFFCGACHAAIGSPVQKRGCVAA